MANRDNKQYLSEMSMMKELQINDEEIKESSDKLLNTRNVQQEINCETSFKKYTEAYNKWNDLSQQEKENNKSKKEILQIINKDK